MDVCTRLGVLAPGEVYHPDQTKTKVIFVVGQLIYAILWLLPTPIFFHLRFLNTKSFFISSISSIFSLISGTSLSSSLISNTESAESVSFASLPGDLEGVFFEPLVGLVTFFKFVILS